MHWETGRFLATLVRAIDPALVLEVGTAIGYSTLHMAQELGRGEIVTHRARPRPGAPGADYLRARGVSDRVEIVEGDATEALERAARAFDLIFLDATKTEYARYLEMAEPKAAERAVLVVDNMLMSGDVALEDDSEAFWSRGEPRERAGVQPGAGQLRALAGRGAADRRRRRVRGAPLGLSTRESDGCSFRSTPLFPERRGQ